MWRPAGLWEPLWVTLNTLALSKEKAKYHHLFHHFIISSSEVTYVLNSFLFIVSYNKDFMRAAICIFFPPKKLCVRWYIFWGFRDMPGLKITHVFFWKQFK